MKRLLTLALAVLLAVPAVAAIRKPTRVKKTAEVRILPSEPGRLTRYLKAYNDAKNGVGAAAVGDARSVRLLLFPAAGNARGANGEFFRSDVTLVSYNETDHQHLVVLWLQNGVETDDPPAVELTLDPNAYYVFTDFVGTILQREGQLGSILIIPIDDEGEIDFVNSAIDGFSRIWTNQPGSTGTVAQPFEAVDPGSFFVFDTASIMGLRHDSQYRTNYGLVNVDDEPLTFTINFLGDNETIELQRTIPAGFMSHTSVPAGNYGPLQIEVTVSNPNALWIAYGTSNDNITGDGWVSIGSGIMTPEDLTDIDGGGQ